ncbi:MAG: ATP-dependent DNA helicase RecQ [Planctomycetota bacterium]
MADQGETETQMPASSVDAARAVFGFDAFRPLQAEAIEAGITGRDALTVLPTGGGKSLCYQVPPLVTKKATVVLSPLIALMRDQVRGLELYGYPSAALHSGVDYDHAAAIERSLIEGELDLVLISPERAVTGSFKTFLAKLHDAGRLGALAVDEAHCISHWGHDFRPEYRRLRELREVCPGVGMQAFTATATPRVREDIARQLGLVDHEVLVGTFDRPNLTYRVVPRQRPVEQIAKLIETSREKHGPGGVIVYCLSRRETEEIAGSLKDHSYDARAYHAGMTSEKRHRVEEHFTNERLDVVCATVAFGMGIDRSNVRLVAHATMPKSIEAYQQETGRAGRDGLEADCVLLYSTGDTGRWERLLKRSADEMGTQRDALNAQLELVHQMRGFAASGACRHKLLSEHFGQSYEPADTARGCGACDVCLGETIADTDSVRTAQIVMSAVARTGQRWGAGHIADVVRGKSNEKVRRQGHHDLSVFGLLQDRSKVEVMAAIDQLTAAGALVTSGGDYDTLAFGPSGMAVMKGEEEVSLARPQGAVRTRRRAEPARPLEGEERDLFEALRALRRELAEERGVPPYVVFSDATLRELCKTKPRTRGAMLETKGIGPAKMEAFGDAFLEAIAENATE